MTRIAFVTLVALSTLVGGCGADATTPPPPPPCDDTCKDGIVLLAIRETAKLAFNLTLQGKPVGEQDRSSPCPFGGAVRVHGSASSNAIQGATEVNLTYELTGCSYMVKDNEPKRTYNTKLTGTLTQVGVLAVQPTATSAIIMKSDAMTFEGSVYDPPIDVALSCPVEMAQSGNTVNGKICGRDATTEL